MNDRPDPSTVLREHLGDSVRERAGVNFHADPDEGWTPPALNDNRALKAQIMAGIEGKSTPGETTTPHDEFTKAAAEIQAGIDRLNQNHGK